MSTNIVQFKATYFPKDCSFLVKTNDHGTDQFIYGRANEFALKDDTVILPDGQIKYPEEIISVSGKALEPFVFFEVISASGNSNDEHFTCALHFEINAAGPMLLFEENLEELLQIAMPKFEAHPKRFDLDRRSTEPVRRTLEEIWFPISVHFCTVWTYDSTWEDDEVDLEVILEGELDMTKLEVKRL